MNYKYKILSWYNIDASCREIYKNMELDRYKPDCVIALLRGGVIPARIFSDFFDILLDFYALDVKLYNGIGITNDKPEIRTFFGADISNKNILIIDDIWDSGKTMAAVLEHFKIHREMITTATLFYKQSAMGMPDYYYETVMDDEWVVFPWERDEFARLQEQEALNEKESC